MALLACLHTFITLETGDIITIFPLFGASLRLTVPNTELLSNLVSGN